MSDFGCFVYLYEEENYSGNDHKLKGKQAKTSLGDWSKRARSLTTGDQTWAELTADGARVLRVGPNTTIRDLKDTPVDNKGFEFAATSIAIYDTEPDKWPGPTTFEDNRLFTMSDLRYASVNREIKGLTSDVIGIVPYAGDVLSLLVSAIWPFGPNTSEVWARSHNWVRDQLHDVMTAAKADTDQAVISGLANLIFDYERIPTQDNFQAIWKHARTLEPKFEEPAEDENTLYYVALFGTIALAVYRVAYFSYDDIYKTGGSADDKKYRLEVLTSAIAALRKSVRDGYAIARERRLDKVWVQDVKHGITGYQFGWTFTARDQYSKWHSPDYDSPGNDVDAAKGHAYEEANYFRGQCAGPSFDATFDVFLQVADLWSYFDQEWKKDFKIPTQKTTVAMGMWGNVSCPQHPLVSQNTHKDYSYKLPDGSVFTKLALTGGKYVDSLRIEVDGKQVAHWGSGGDKSLDLTLDKEQRVSGVFGAWGKWIDHVSFRVLAFKDGKPDYPKEVGLGHSTGGLPFSCSGSDGGNGELTGFFAQVGYDDRLAGLGFYWTHDRVVPRTKLED